MENEKLIKKIQKNEFNQTENALIILSFEKNLKQKEELFRRKLEESQKSENEMNNLNDQLSILLEEIMKMDEKINSSKNLQANLIANLEKVELNWARKTQELQTINSEIEIYGKKLAQLQLDFQKLEESLKLQDRRFSQSVEREIDEVEKKKNLEMKVREIITKNVHEEIGRVLLEGRKSALNFKLEYN